MEKVIRPKKGFIGIDFKELYCYRELFLFLSWKNILVRYKQTIIGIGWAVVRPILTMLIFSFIFGRIAKLPSGGVPYPILIFAALLPWQLFATSLNESSNSIISNPNFITKIYFPRLIIPASVIIASMADFLISLVILSIMMIWYGIVPSLTILWLPLFMILALLASFGAGLWFSALNVEYRDIKYVVPFIVQMGLYISPVGFNSSVIPEKWRMLYSLNPMVSVIDGFRWSILGEKFAPNPMAMMVSTFTVLVILISGVLYFRRMERSFADII